MADKFTSKCPPGIDGRILKWTIEALDDDHEWEQFFAGIPGFFESNLIDNPDSIRSGLHKTFVGALRGFLDRTLTSNLATEPSKTQRFVTCFRAAASTGIDQEFFHDALVSGRWDGVLQSAEMVNYLNSRGNDRGREMDLYTQSMVAGVIANVRERDSHWLALTKDQLHISDDVLQDYVAHGDSVLLANLINITGKILRTFEGDHGSAHISSKILRSVSQLDILGTLPKLQHEFCALWNDVVQEARKREPNIVPIYIVPIYILRYIRHLYIALHQRTDASPTMFSSSTADHDDVLFHGSSYPLCSIGEHRVISGEITQYPVATSSTTV